MSKGPLLSEQTAEAITRMITEEHRFRAGDKLPNELDLSQELNVSRITLRESIRVLCTKGFLEIRRGRGTFVISDKPDGEATARVTEPGDTSLRDLLEIRLALEPAAAYYAAKRISEEELRNLEELIQQMEAAAAQGKPFLPQEREFHNAVARAAQNPMFTRILPLLSKSVYTDLTGSRESGSTAVRDYREIVRYLSAHNGEGAREFMRIHILHSFQFAGQEIE